MKRIITAIALLATLILPGPPPAVAREPAETLNRLLVAKPTMSDPRFQESVVLVTRHGGPGPIGLILNKPTEIHLNDLFSDLPEMDEQTGRVYFGGPVSNEILAFMVETESQPRKALSIVDQIYLALDPDLLRDFIDHPEQRRELRVFSGYAGWGPGQLEAEIERGDWWELPLRRKYLFTESPETLWKRLVRELEGQWVRAPSPLPARAA